MTFTRVSDSDRLAGDTTCITLNELAFFPSPQLGPVQGT